MDISTDWSIILSPRFSTKCVRRELFCDGRINCAWPYVEPAGKFSNKERIRRARGLPQIKQIEFSGQKITANNKSFYDLYFLLPQPPTWNNLLVYFLPLPVVFHVKDWRIWNSLNIPSILTNIQFRGLDIWLAYLTLNWSVGMNINNNYEHYYKTKNGWYFCR